MSKLNQAQRQALAQEQKKIKSTLKQSSIADELPEEIYVPQKNFKPYPIHTNKRTLWQKIKSLLLKLRKKKS